MSSNSLKNFLHESL